MKIFIQRLHDWTGSQKNRNILIQFFFLIFVILTAYYLVTKALLLDITLSHFTSRAGFGLSHSFIIDYTSNDNRWMAYFTGMINTVRICIVGIILATLLGTVMGVARLSKNVLFSTISLVYVETLRNTPLLIQIIFWQIVFLKLPRITEAITFGNTVVISNRGVLLPYAVSTDNGNGTAWVYIVCISLVLSLVTSFLINKREDIQGKVVQLYNYRLGGNLIGIVLFLFLTVTSYFILQKPFALDLPTLYQNDKGTFLQSGGFEFTPEFGAILFALVMYTGTFITEIVRGSIQSLQKGQTEAAQAIGLTNYQTMTLIILPQALRSIIPPLTNQYLNLTKNSSLSVVIAYPEIFMVSRTIMNNSGRALPVFFLILFTYLSLSLIISLIMNILNKRVTRIGT